MRSCVPRVNPPFPHNYDPTSRQGLRRLGNACMTMRSLSPLLWASLMAGCASAGGTAPAAAPAAATPLSLPPVRDIGPAVAQITLGAKQQPEIRPLSDGRVLVLDVMGHKLSLADANLAS